MKQLQRIFKALGNPRRLAIVKLLQERKELSVGTIARYIHLSATSTSKHLIALTNVDVLEKRQERLVVYYRVAEKPDSPVRDVCKLISATD